jgi:hypothetical protein
MRALPAWIKVARGLRVRTNPNNGITRIDIDPTTVKQLRDAYATAREGACTYVFCPGPDEYRPTPMATCSKCATAILLRRALKRLDIMEASKNNGAHVH